MALIVSVLGLILTLLSLLKPDDVLLQNRRLLLLFCSTVIMLSLALCFFFFSSVRRRLNRHATGSLRDVLSARGYSSYTSTKDFECWIPEKRHFFRFRSEKVCMSYHENGEIFAEFPRYLMLTLPKEFWLPPPSTVAR